MNLKLSYSIIALFISVTLGACAKSPSDISTIISSSDWVTLSPIISGIDEDKVYAVRKEKIQALESWDVNVAPVPLAMDQVRMAILEKKVSSEKFPTLEDIELLSVTYKRIERSQSWAKNKWYCVVEFAYVYDGVARESKEPAYLLSSGLVVDETIGKL